ncbi:35682_t:CDS:2, partial [Racocetra persica]
DKIFRNTTANLIPYNSNKISTIYKFIISDQPSYLTENDTVKEPKFHAESEAYNDIIIIPTSEHDDIFGAKIYKTFNWLNNHKFDYLIKANDDTFARMDTLIRELYELGPGKELYWRGFVYWNIPLNNENLVLPVLPPYTESSLYILS